MPWSWWNTHYSITHEIKGSSKEAYNFSKKLSSNLLGHKSITYNDEISTLTISGGSLFGSIGFTISEQGILHSLTYLFYESEHGSFVQCQTQFKALGIYGLLNNSLDQERDNFIYELRYHFST